MIPEKPDYRYLKPDNSDRYNFPETLRPIRNLMAMTQQRDAAPGPFIPGS